MSTTNAELREQCAKAYYEVVDAILETIAAAGWRMVPPEAGSHFCVKGECWSHDGSEWAGWFDEALASPGDLDPIEGVSHG